MKQQTRYLMALITLLAFGVRVYLLDSVPPGWSDDELSNVLVIAQKPLNGNFAVYYTDATGLEALYHALSAVPLVLFGYNSLGVRLLSAVLGTLTVPLTYVVNLLRGLWIGERYLKLADQRVGIAIVFLEFLSCTADRESFFVQQVADYQDRLYFLWTIVAVSRPVFLRAETGKLRLPIS